VIRTAFCESFNVEHPVALGGMGSIYAPPLVAAVSEAGGLGALGCHGLSPEQIRTAVKAIRARTSKPFGLNFLLFVINEDSFAAALAEKPAVIAFAWPRGSQELKPWIDRAHGIGAKVTFMVNDVTGARRAADAGADCIVAQGTEGGGHVAWMGSIALTPMVVDAVAPVPVLSAGGFAEGRGLAAALALGASGVLFGTRFLASDESPLHANYKNAILESDGHDTVLSEIPDIAMNLVWPGAMSRSRRNRFIERWSGREWALRQNQPEALAAVQAARKSGDVQEAPLSFGQDAGLIKEILPAGELVRRIVADAERAISKLPRT
jgi:NAD(P)H-dependent flavin oxidoreductase YrpB (nitropropane dioxygenase family)